MSEKFIENWIVQGSTAKLQNLNSKKQTNSKIKISKFKSKKTLGKKDPRIKSEDRAAHPTRSIRRNDRVAGSASG
jgi:hypothetical protein